MRDQHKEQLIGSALQSLGVEESFIVITRTTFTGSSRSRFAFNFEQNFRRNINAPPLMPMIQRALIVFALLVPLVLVGIPYIGEFAPRIMPPISGTYDVLLLAAPLPKEQVRALLPKTILDAHPDALLDVPDSVQNALLADSSDASPSNPRRLNDDEHVVLLQMGYQRQTGPGPSWMPKMSFGECKLEIPYVRHPHGSKDIDVPFVYKQHILSDNPIIKTSSAVLGLTSASARFSPQNAPRYFAADEAEIMYKAEGYLDAKATQPASLPDTSVADASWRAYNELLQAWWFGEGTGATAQKFAFDIGNAGVKPKLYDVVVDIELQAFAVRAPGAKKALPSGKTTLRGLGWRVAAPITSLSERADKIRPT